ncbi:hypothetical protein PoB_000959500 [Plakobranchus ocellatus]|uniref:Uncharacterized protein n=1 Tax=Plakobranchus ocellatus TaxID=259542 RepID=A0AAV3YJ24_9GAST|nr:hypothetical protein PoB_000959500 [Plakobranchus ocellatus]
MLREKVWFKNMHTAVEQAVKNCFAYQVATPTTEGSLQISGRTHQPLCHRRQEEREMAETEYDPQPEELESAAEPEPGSNAVPAPIPHQLSRLRQTKKMPERFKDFSMKY